MDSSAVFVFVGSIDFPLPQAGGGGDSALSVLICLPALLPGTGEGAGL